MTKLILLAAFLSVAVGCGSKTKDYDYMAGRDYRTKPQLRQALLNGNEPISEAAVQKILASKVAMPKKINLAIVRLAESNDGLDFQTIEPEVASEFFDKSKWGERVQSLIPVPQVMLPKPVTLASLRQAAVLLQADALLIVKPMSFADYRYRMFDENKAKAVTSLEVLLLDTRTSVVPFTSVITETAEVVKAKSDYNDFEMTERARKASEVKALMQVAPAVGKFVAKTM